ncbi:nucleotidyl transferase AbiEii/AbiGii toxin family protein [Candidatus Daviesbacteria bacterium]|nr:nucleotidyl transferase AbiEii/AbiGii toxin family protein [Candidatus Daviesbacteria bacterium]
METGQAKLLKDITHFLNTSKIPYMITGSWSSIYYGRPRASHDIDFVVELPVENIEKTMKLFSRLPDTFMIELDTIREAIENNSQFQSVHLPTMLKMDFWVLTDQEFDKVRFSRRKKVRLFNQIMEMATPEDTIIQKLIWFSKGGTEKHLVDAAFVLQIQGKKLDRKYLHKWINKLKLKKYFEMLKKIDLEEYI